jgi:hypothetical protein
VGKRGEVDTAELNEIGCEQSHTENEELNTELNVIADARR